MILQVDEHRQEQCKYGVMPKATDNVLVRELKMVIDGNQSQLI